MDNFQKRVLRLKRPILCEVLGFSPQIQKKLRDKGMLTDDMIAEIVAEQTEFSQMSKYLEIFSNRETNSFDKLCKFLEEEDHAWLVDEMQANLLQERGDLVVEPYIFREAGMEVHRRFGRTTRIPETDKKEIQSLVAERYQAAKEASKRQLTDLRDELNIVDFKKRQENGKLKVLVEKVITFVEIQRGRLNEYAHSIMSTSHLIEEDDHENSKRDYRTILEKTVDDVLEIISRLLLEKETAEDERKRCLKVLNITKPVVQMDIILEDALQRAAEEQLKNQRNAELSDQMAQSLDSRMKALKLETDRELQLRQRMIQHMESETSKREARIRSLESDLANEKNVTDDLEEQIKKLQEEIERLQKTRRLGYYYPGWYDKGYYIEDYNELDSSRNTPVPVKPKKGINYSRVKPKIDASWKPGSKPDPKMKSQYEMHSSRYRKGTLSARSLDTEKKTGGKNNFQLNNSGMASSAEASRSLEILNEYKSPNQSKITLDLSSSYNVG